MNQPSDLSFTEQITFLHCNNIGTTARFYQEMLGLPCVVDQGACKVFHVCGTAYVGFCEHFESKDVGNTVIITFVTNEVDEWYQMLLDHGVDFEQAPQQNEKYGIYHAFLRDPDGYLVEIQRFNDPKWSVVPAG